MTDTRAQGFNVVVENFPFEPDDSPAGMRHEGVTLYINIEISGAIYTDSDEGHHIESYVYISTVEWLSVVDIEGEDDEATPDARNEWSEFIAHSKTMRNKLISQLDLNEDVQGSIINGN